MDIKPFQYKADQVCTRCIMDDTVQGITFDQNGECTFCKIHDEIEKGYSLKENPEIKLKLKNSKSRKRCEK